MTPRGGRSSPHAAPAARPRKQRLEPGERRRRLAALTAVLVLHLLFAIAAYRAAQLHRPDAAPAPRTAEAVMHLRLIDAWPDSIAVPALPMPPPSRAAPMPSASSPAAPPADADETGAAPLAAATGTTPEPDRADPAPRWIGRDGTPRLPAPVEAPRTFSNRPLREAGATDPHAQARPLDLSLPPPLVLPAPPPGGR